MDVDLVAGSKHGETNNPREWIGRVKRMREKRDSYYCPC